MRSFKIFLLLLGLGCMVFIAGCAASSKHKTADEILKQGETEQMTTITGQSFLVPKDRYVLEKKASAWFYWDNEKEGNIKMVQIEGAHAVQGHFSGWQMQYCEGFDFERSVEAKKKIELPNFDDIAHVVFFKYNIDDQHIRNVTRVYIPKAKLLAIFFAHGTSKDHEEVVNLFLKTFTK